MSGCGFWPAVTALKGDVPPPPPFRGGPIFFVLITFWSVPGHPPASAVTASVHQGQRLHFLMYVRLFPRDLSSTAVPDFILF